MADEARAEVSAVWDTLVRTGLSERVDVNTTITPSLYRAAGDEVSLPPPMGADTDAILDALPLVRVAEEGDPRPADLRIQGLLGTGGMGTVHVARQVSLDRDVAVKRLKSSERSHVEALLREAVITGALEHPNIAPVHSLGRDGEGHPVLVMRRIEGRRWSALLPEPDDASMLGSAALDRNLEILAGVCHALHYAHSRGIVHRDVKPENVLVGEYGEVVLLDWGIASRLGEPASGVALGTVGYMAPEMASGQEADVRTDVYLLGATLHRLLVGRSRHHRPNVLESMMSAWKSAPWDYAPEVPAELAAICHKSMARRSGARFESALAFHQALDAYQRHRTSRLLAEAAGARVEEHNRLLADPRAEVARIDEVGRSALHGLREALDSWSENSVARDALRQCLEQVVPWEVQYGDAERAAALLPELVALEPEGSRRYATLTTEVEAAVRRARALVRLGQELDMSRGSGLRVAFLLAFAVSAALVGGLVDVVVRLGLVQMSHGLGVVVAVFAATSLSLVLLIGHRWLLHTLANQRVMFSVLVTGWAVVLHRTMGWFLGAEIYDVMAQEILLLALASAVTGVTIDLRIFWLTGILLLLAVVASFVPTLALEMTLGSIALTGVVLAVLLWHWVRF